MTSKIFTILLSVLVFAACGSKKENEEKVDATTAAKVKADSISVSNQIVGVGRIVPEKQIIQLASETNGILKNIYKEENQSVNAGDVVAELSNQIETAQLEAAKSKIANQNEQANSSDAAIAEYASKLNLSEINLKRAKNLLSKGAETQQEVDNAESEYKTLLATVSKLKSQSSTTKSQINEINANINLAKVKLAQRQIKSPVTGKILEWKVRPGESIMGQQIIAQIAPAGNKIVECEIDEALADRVAIDQTATVRYIGRTETIASGKVYFISDYLRKKSLFSEQSGEPEDRRVRVVKIMLGNADKILLNSKVEIVISSKN